MDPDISHLESLFLSMGLPPSALHDALNDPLMRGSLDAATSTPTSQASGQDTVAQIQRAKERYEEEKRLGPAPRPPLSRAAVRTAVEHDRQELQELFARKDKAMMRHTNVAFPKHSSCTPLDKLAQITLSDMQVRKTHYGSYLLCRTFTRPARLVAISLAIEDTNGDVQPVSIYNFPGAFLAPVETVDEIFPPGTVFAIREPTLKLAAVGGMAFIRVDSPTDVVFLGQDDEIARSAVWRTRSPSVSGRITAPDWKERGNVHFKQRRYLAASIAYTRGLELESTSHTLLLNRSLAYLNLEYYSSALADATAALDDTTIAGLERVKPLYRAARARYGLKEYSEARQLFENVLAVDGEQQESKDWLRRCDRRMAESREGDPAYDWVQMFKDGQQNPYLDVADWTGPVEVVPIPQRGRGMVTTRAVHAGELLIVSKAFAAAFPPKTENGGTRELLFSVNHLTNRLDEHPRVEMIARTIGKVMAEPSLAPLVYGLYSGPSGPPPSSMYPPPLRGSRDPPSPVLDVDVLRIEHTCSFNSFGPECIGPAEEELEAKSAIDRTASWICFGDVMVIRATQALQAGDEVTIPYSGGVSYLDRAVYLEHFTSACDCWLCSQERIDGEERCRQRAQLVDAMKGARLGTRSIAQAREFVRSMLATYCSNGGPATVRPGMSTAYEALAHALSRAARQNPAMYHEAVETHMHALQSIGIAVVDKSVRGRLAKTKAAMLPIATLQAPIQSTQAPMVALMICALFCAMLDDNRARRWLKAAQWLNNVTYGGGEALFRVRYKAILEQVGIKKHLGL